MIDITNVAELYNRSYDFMGSLLKIMMGVGVDYDRLEEYIYVGIDDREKFDNLFDRMIDAMLGG